MHLHVSNEEEEKNHPHNPCCLDSILLGFIISLLVDRLCLYIKNLNESQCDRYNTVDLWIIVDD